MIWNSNRCSRWHLIANNVKQQIANQFQPISVEDGFIFTSVKNLNPDDAYTLQHQAGHLHKWLFSHVFHHSHTIGDKPAHRNYLPLIHDSVSMKMVLGKRTYIEMTDRTGHLSECHFIRLYNVSIIPLKDMAFPWTKEPVIWRSTLRLYGYCRWYFAAERQPCVNGSRMQAVLHNTLGIWYNGVVNCAYLSLPWNVLFRESYVDTLISCHFTVSLIMYMAEQLPDVPCHFDLTGTDGESYFFINGQWIGNQQTYIYIHAEKPDIYDEAWGNLGSLLSSRVCQACSKRRNDMVNIVEQWQAADMSYCPTIGFAWAAETECKTLKIQLNCTYNVEVEWSFGCRKTSQASMFLC